MVVRACSALKECLENSVDAGATLIKNSQWHNNFEIQDNGSGIMEEDLTLLCTRYATSKIQSFDDLTNLYTFGFRGEALSAISIAAKVTVITKTGE